MTGFPPETFAFLEGITANNEKPWFDSHRDLYEAGYVAPARAFVEEVGPLLREISPGVQFAPKIGASIGRVNRDTRFSRDKRTYKDHLDILFWHGDKRGWTEPGFFMRLTAESVWLGAGMHHFEDGILTRYREAALGEPSGEALADAIAEVEAAGDYIVGGMPRKSIPRGYDKAHPRVGYLLWEGLTAMAQAPIADAMKPDWSDRALAHFRATWPIGQWIARYVAN